MTCLNNRKYKINREKYNNKELSLYTADIRIISEFGQRYFNVFRKESIQIKYKYFFWTNNEPRVLIIMTRMSGDINWKSYLDENDESAFSRLYTDHVNDLYAYGLSLGATSDTCLDAIQDIFYNLYLRRNRLRYVNNIRFYLLRSLRNRLLDIRKQQYATETINDKTLTFAIEVSVADLFEHEEERMLLKQRVERLLGMLTDRQREAVYLRYMQGLDYDRIAAVMRMNAASVRKLVYRALEVIRKQTMSR